MSADLDKGISPLSQTVQCEGRELYIEISDDGEGQWMLAVTNDKAVTNHWNESFETDQLALDAALEAIREEGLAGFGMDTLCT